MWRESQLIPGQVTGYAVGHPGDNDIVGRQVWFGGSKLAPDLSLPKIEARWAAAAVEVSNLPRTGARVRAEERNGAFSHVDRTARLADCPAMDRARPSSPDEIATLLPDLFLVERGGNATSSRRQVSGNGYLRHVPHPSTSGALPGWGKVGAGFSLLADLAPGEHRYVVLVATHLARISDAMQAARVPPNPRDREAPIAPRARHVSVNRAQPGLAPRSSKHRRAPSINPRRDTGPTSSSRA